MAVTLNGYVISLSPRDFSLISYPISQQVAAGAVTTILFPSQFNGNARSILLSNRDGANAGFVRLNGLTSSQIRIPPSGSFAFSEQWINLIEITAGAAGIMDLAAEIVPLNGGRE